MEDLLAIIIIVFGVLQIILFFKIWGMTNNVSKMKCMMEMKIKQENLDKDTINRKTGSDIAVGDLVVELKNERQLKVIAITADGEYRCMVPGGIVEAGVFSRDEIELFDRYWGKANDNSSRKE